MLFYILIFTFLGSIVSLVGGIILLFWEKFTLKISHFLASFAAGTLLGAAFFDLLPEALEEAGGVNIPFWTLIGILTFFLLERFIHWFHHHHNHSTENTEPTVPLIILGDGVHNFIDGIAIAATFLVSIPLGITTAFAVVAHEIPQEIGDFGILLHKGLSRKKVLLANILSTATAFVGAIATFLLGDVIKDALPALLSLTGGFFIYIAASDLIPEIHEENRKGFAFIESTLLLLGVGTIWIFVFLLE
jgi:zinc and cadmium transporter